MIRHYFGGAEWIVIFSSQLLFIECDDIKKRSDKTIEPTVSQGIAITGIGGLPGDHYSGTVGGYRPEK
jgi:hypothetical protein